MQPQFTPKDIARYWKYVDKSGGPDACWPWQGAPAANGYGRLRVAGTTILAHRIAFFLAHGRWAEPMTLHSCPGGGNRWCCNPAHLYEGGASENALDMVAAGRRRTPPMLGEKNNLAKLTEADVREIRRLHAEGVTMKDITKRFDVGYTNIFQIVKRKTWRHVE